MSFSFLSLSCSFSLSFFLSFSVSLSLLLSPELEFGKSNFLFPTFCRLPPRILQSSWHWLPSWNQQRKYKRGVIFEMCYWEVKVICSWNIAFPRLSHRAFHIDFYQPKGRRKGRWSLMFWVGEAAIDGTQIERFRICWGTKLNENFCQFWEKLYLYRMGTCPVINETCGWMKTFRRKELVFHEK